MRSLNFNPNATSSLRMQSRPSRMRVSIVRATVTADAPLTESPSVSSSDSTSAASLPLESFPLTGVVHAPKPRRRSLRLPLLTSVSAFVELQAATRKFETLAGRMAMVGVTLALAVELIDGAPIVSLASLGQVISPELGEELFMSALVSAISFASLLAIESMSWSTRRGQPLLEGVVASLTSIHRSGSAVTVLRGEKGALDLAVDQIVTTLDVTFDDEEVEGDQS